MAGSDRPLLFASEGCGSAIVECLYALAGITIDIEWLPYLEPGPGRDRLLALNPTGQVPTVLLPDGSVVTESAAIALLIDDAAPQAGLVPPLGSPLRAPFLRWLIYLVAQIYPTFTYADDPARWVGPEAAAALSEQVIAHRKTLWQAFDAAADTDGPWVLGTTFSALDVYVAVMRHWRPRAAWFAEHCPRLNRSAVACSALPAIAPILRANGAPTLD